MDCAIEMRALYGTVALVARPANAYIYELAFNLMLDYSPIATPRPDVKPIE